MPTEALHRLFHDFLDEPDAGRALAPLLQGQPPDRVALGALLDEVGEGRAAALGEALDRFVATFLQAAAADAALAPYVASSPAPAPLPEGLLAEVRELIALVRERGIGNVGIGPISVGSVHGQTVVVGSHQVFHVTSDEGRRDEAARAMREGYLRHLFTTLRELQVASVDPVAVERATRLHLDGVYTALLTEESEAQPREAMERDQQRLSALAQLDHHRRLVLREQAA